MKVLVTGAAGFIGSFVTRALLGRGDDVVGIDNFNSYYPRGCKEFNVDLTRMYVGQPPKKFDASILNPVHTKINSLYPKTVNTGTFTFYEGDITDYTFLSDVFNGTVPDFPQVSPGKIDKVIHLAAMAGVPYSTKNPRLYTQVNVDGTMNLLELSGINSVQKFVFGSSSSVYGNRVDKKVAEDDDVSKAVSIYGASKVAGEVLCHAFHVINGLLIVIDRIFGPIYGPLQRPYGMFHQRAINYLYNSKQIQIYGKNGLETAKDSTYIDDQVAGILACLDYTTAFDIFNIGTSNPLPIKIWVDAIEQAFSAKLALEVVEVDKADVVSSADITKAKNLLQYRPKTDMYEGVKRQVEVFTLMPEWYKVLEV